MTAPEPFDDFLARVEAATLAQYPEARCSADELARMKAHVLAIYRGVHPARTFADDAGHAIDCIPFEEQPSVRAARAAGQAIQTTPPPAARLAGMPAEEAAAPPRPSPCPEGTVPLTRITLEELTRYATLEEALHRGSKQAPPSGRP